LNYPSEDWASGGGWIRTASETPGNTALSAKGGAESGALTPTKTNIDPALSALIDAWPMLPEAIRAGILAMIRAAVSGGEATTIE
jgi:hypothetical protein